MKNFKDLSVKDKIIIIVYGASFLWLAGESFGLLPGFVF